MAKVLCIDDNPSGLRIRALLLQAFGYSVDTAETGDAALHQFRHNRYDVVVTDYFLGETTGTGLAREMKQMRTEVPVVLLSGIVEPPSGMEYVDAFLEKSEPPTKLAATIAGLVPAAVA